MRSYSGDQAGTLRADQQSRLTRALESVAPGTALREGLDQIVQGRTGGLICAGSADALSLLVSGGIELDLEQTPPLLYQLAKMDGAIILSADATRIRWANAQLMPDAAIVSHETGTRHRTAERVSKQTDALVIAVSQTRDVISLYLEGHKYVLEDIPLMLAKANQALAALDTYRKRFDEMSTRLSGLEFALGVTLHEVLTMLQRAELVNRMAIEIERHTLELGIEGRLIQTQLEETTAGVADEKLALLRDYLVDDSEQAVEAVRSRLETISHHELLDFGRLAELLGYERGADTIDRVVGPRGYRALGQITRLPSDLIEAIVREFGGLDHLLSASNGDLEAVDGVDQRRARDVHEGLRRLQEGNLVDRYLKT